MKLRIPSLPCGFAFLATTVLACGPTSSLPGDSLGTFNVVGTLGTNTCGSALGLTNPWDFQIEMSENGATLYLAVTDGSGQMSGPVSGSSAVLTSTATVNVHGADAGASPCDLTLTATFDVDLNSATSPTAFTGSVLYAYAVPTGVDCTGELASSGGAYATLPCSVTYSLSGTHQ